MAPPVLGLPGPVLDAAGLLLGGLLVVRERATVSRDTAAHRGPPPRALRQ
jgi:hypothetical protein